MSQTKKLITREELFELVWSKPKTKVAEDLGISDSAIHKIYRKLKVPMPPQGHWLAKNRRNQPATKGSTVHAIQRRSYPDISKQFELAPEATMLIAFEKNPKTLGPSYVLSFLFPHNTDCR